MKYISAITILALTFSAFTIESATSIYTQHFTSLNGDEIALSQYQGKKMLLVNIASESPLAAVQIPQMEQLFQQFKDSLEVIGFFSNDFNNQKNRTERIP